MKFLFLLLPLLLMACENKSELFSDEYFKLEYSKSDNSLFLNYFNPLPESDSILFFEVLEYDTNLNKTHHLVRLSRGKDKYKVKLKDKFSFYKSYVTDLMQSKVYFFKIASNKDNLKFSEIPFLENESNLKSEYFQDKIKNEEYSGLCYHYLWLSEGETNENTYIRDYSFILSHKNQDIRNSLLLSFFRIYDLKDSVNYYLNELVNSNTPEIFNFEKFVSLNSSYLLSNKKYHSKLLKLCLKYPDSYFTQRIISFSHKFIDTTLKDELFQVFNLLKKSQNFKYSILSKASFVFNNNLSQEYNSTRMELMLLYDILKNVHYFEDGLDKDRTLTWGKHNVYTKLIEANIRNDNLLEAQNFIYEVVNIYPPFDGLLTVTYFQQALIFDKLNIKDSSIVYYVKSLKMDPSFSYSIDSLKQKYFKNTLFQKNNFNDWLDSLKSVTKINTINIEYELKEKFSFSNLLIEEQNTLLIFISENCSICWQLCKDLYSSSKIQNELNTIFVTNSNENNIRKKIIESGISNPKIFKSSRLIDFFNVKAFPVIVGLNSDYDVVLYNNGYNANYNIERILFN